MKPFSSVFIVDFKKVNASWDYFMNKHKQKLTNTLGNQKM